MGRAEQDSQILMRIVAMLISFADLASRASCASWPIRCLVLAILRRAEAIARFYAVGAGVSALAPIRIPRDGADECAELANLSLRFRMLALTLLVAAARSSLVSMPPDRGWSASAIIEIKVAEALAERVPACPDTS